MTQSRPTRIGSHYVTAGGGFTTLYTCPANATALVTSIGSSGGAATFSVLASGTRSTVLAGVPDPFHTNQLNILLEAGQQLEVSGTSVEAYVTVAETFVPVG